MKLYEPVKLKEASMLDWLDTIKVGHIGHVIYISEAGDIVAHFVDQHGCNKGISCGPQTKFEEIK